MNDLSVNNLPTICVVIPTWNRCEDLIECINSVYETHYPFLDIVVVDNASSDGTSDAIKNLFPKVSVIQLNENFGASVATNKGINFAIHAKADYILRLDSDIIVDKNMIHEMIKFALLNSNAGIIFPKIYRYDKPDTIWYTGAQRNPILIISKVDNYNVVDDNKNDFVREIDFVPSAAILMPSNIFELIKGFDENFFVYSEDFDLCMRVKKVKRKIFFVPFAKAWHKIGSEKLNEFGLFHFYRSKLLFYRKHSSGLHRALLVFYTFVYILYRSFTKYPHEPIKPSIKGFFDGLKIPIMKN